MKRRDFLAASALLTLFAASPVEAAKKAAAKAAATKAKPVANKANAKTTSNKGGGTKKTTAKTTPEKKSNKTKARAPAALSEVATPPQESAPSEPHNVLSLPDEPLPQWRMYEIHSSIKLTPVKGKTRIWLPLVQYKDTLWERSLGHRWQGNFSSAGIYRDPVAEMEVFYADWADGASDPHLEITSQVATQDRHFDITRRGAIAERTEVLRRCLKSTEQVPIDEIIRRTAERAIGRVKDPLAQAKAIYDWVIENVSFDPNLKHLGNGNIGELLESGNLYGRSADIALLFVGLCRAIGIPARPVFGLRIDASRLFAGLGVRGDLSQAQQCRAEFYTPGYGWIPVNPSDVRQAILDEKLINGDAKLTVLKKLLFGFWEMNWVAFNAAQDVNLRGAAGQSLPFLVLPEVETNEARFNSHDKTRMTYKVSANRTEG